MTAESLASILAQAFARAGTTASFGVPGGGPNLDVVGALDKVGIDFVLAHAESSAAIMASTHGLLTRTPTPVVVTRGPGATSVANGAAQATLDRYPLVVVADTVPANQRGRVAHQRIDQRALFDPIVKRSATLSSQVDGGAVAALLDDAVTWPFGAVHIDYDADGSLDGPLDSDTHRSGVQSVGHEQSARGLDAAVDLVEGSRRPVVIVGVEAAAAVDRDRLRQLLTDFAAPVLTTYQAIGLVDTEGPVWAGLFTNGALERPVLEAADLVITIGLDTVEPIPASWTVGAPVIRLTAVASGEHYMPVGAEVVAPLAESARALLRPGHDWPPGSAGQFRTAARAAIAGTESSDHFGPVQLVRSVSQSLPTDITTTVDAGAHFLAIMPLWPVEAPHRLLISNGLATMGFAVPAAIGAATARPDQPVVAMTGDGGMSMTLAELETIGRRALPITVVVFNDAALSLIRIKQGPGQGGKPAVDYRRTDFADAARAMGIEGYVVNSGFELRTLLADGWDTPRLIDVRIDPAGYPALLAVTRG